MPNEHPEINIEWNWDWAAKVIEFASFCGQTYL